MVIKMGHGWSGILLPFVISGVLFLAYDKKSGKKFADCPPFYYFCSVKTSMTYELFRTLLNYY